LIVTKAKKDPDAKKDDTPEKEAGLTAVDAPQREPENPLVLDPKIEALFRKIAKEEIGRALGHTIV
jgi:hypothetical protein